MIWALLLTPVACRPDRAACCGRTGRGGHCCCWPRRRTPRWWPPAGSATAARGRRLDGRRRGVALVPQHHQRALPGGRRLCRRLSGAARAGREHRHDEDEDLPFVNFPEAVFTGCLLLFLATMTLVAVSRHLGLMWVGVEATTLASAPLIYFHRHHRSLEATWKYLLICSVGIALALLGNFFVAVAARSGGGPTIRLTIDDLVGPRRQPEPAVAQGGVPVLPGRLRHEDGTGAAAHLAARRPQRGPLGRFGAAVRGPVELRLPDDPPRPLPAWPPPGWPPSAPSCWCSSG